MDEIKKLLEALLAVVKTDEDKKNLIDAIHADARAQIWTPIANRGFDAGKAEGAKTAKATDDDVLRLNGQIADLQKDLEKAKEKTPSSEKVKELEGTIKTLTDQRNTAISTFKQKLRDTFTERAVTDFQKSLEDSGLDPKVARLEAVDFRRRMEYVDGAGEYDLPVLKVYESAENKVPLTAPNGQDVMSVVVADVMKNAPPGAITSNSDSGADTRSSTPTGGTKKSHYDDIRKGVEEQQKQAANTRPDIVGAFKGSVPAGVAGTGR
jgi:hypothetical protein